MRNKLIRECTCGYSILQKGSLCMIIAYHRVIVFGMMNHSKPAISTKKDSVYRLSICNTKLFGPKLQWLSYIRTLAGMIDISIAS